MRRKLDLAAHVSFMKIHSIELEGLWSYTEPQRIDIAGIPMLTGVGKNGAGKSMILVASIVAAFYGKFPTSTIDKSISHSAQQGTVSIEFEIGGTLHRVSRTYSRGNTAPSGKLLVQDSTQASGWRSLISGKGISEVNAGVNALLGMNYETATMTWISEQRDSGKFASAQPTDRFKLLSGVFDLDKYTPMASAAKKHVASTDKAIERIDGRIAELNESLGDAGIDPSGEPEKGSLTLLTEDQLNWKAAQLDTEIDRVSVSIADLTAGDPSRKTIEARQAYELVRNERVSRNTAARATFERATQNLAAAKARAVSARAAAEARFTSEVDGAARRSHTIRDTAARSRQEANAALLAITAAVRDLPAHAATVKANREAATEARNQAELWSANIDANTAVYATEKAAWTADGEKAAEINVRIEILHRNATADADHSQCFSCGQHLTAADALALIASQEQELAAITARRTLSRAASIAGKDAAAAGQVARKANLDAALSHDGAANDAAAAVTRAEALIATQGEREAVEATAAAAIKAAGKDEADALVKATAEHTATTTAAAAEESAAVAAAEGEIRENGPVVEASGEPGVEEQKLAATLAALELVVADEAAQVAVQHQILSSERATLRAEASTYEAEKARRKEIASLRADQADRLKAITKERGVAVMDRTLHDALFKAYSPAGIPAMVLAGVIDELNEAVNVVLNRLSGGTLSVRLSTTRETAKGALENKVSVFIDTPEGTLEYASLSGGQRFRVDLAIRTGLSATIARSTGTPIETFVLDEGWGSLDEEGIQATIDTVFRFSEEKNMITISHIAPVIEAFPMRVEVTLTGGSSVAQVVAA
jgi:exonuclease SbcC